MRILIVEDDALLGDGLRVGLKQAGYAADWVRDGMAADLALASERIAAVVLDLGLPKRAGLDVLRRLRAAKDPVPVLILTARDAVADRIAGLDAGADDYLVKPCDLGELAARLRALIRRSAGQAAPVIEIWPLRIDPAGYAVVYRGVPVELSAREFALLHELAGRQGACCPRNRSSSAYIAGGGTRIQRHRSAYPPRTQEVRPRRDCHLARHRVSASQGSPVKTPASLRWRLFSGSAVGGRCSVVVDGLGGLSGGKA